jgi:hypothetical protein
MLHRMRPTYLSDTTGGPVHMHTVESREQRELERSSMGPGDTVPVVKKCRRRRSEVNVFSDVRALVTSKLIWITPFDNFSLQLSRFHHNVARTTSRNHSIDENCESIHKFSLFTSNKVLYKNCSNKSFNYIYAKLVQKLFDRLIFFARIVQITFHLGCIQFIRSKKGKKRKEKINCQFVMS